MRLLVRPIVSLLPALEPAIATPSVSRLQPSPQFTETSRNTGVDVREVPLPVSFRLELEERWLIKDPVGLPVFVELEDQFILEKVPPLAGIVFLFPLMHRNRAKRLFDFHQLAAPAKPMAKLAAMVDDRGADDFENRLEQRLICPALSKFAERVKASPPYLNRSVELDDRVQFAGERFVFADRGANLTISEIEGIEHESFVC